MGLQEQLSRSVSNVASQCERIGLVSLAKELRNATRIYSERYTLVRIKISAAALVEAVGSVRKDAALMVRLDSPERAADALESLLGKARLLVTATDAALLECDAAIDERDAAQSAPKHVSAMPRWVGTRGRGEAGDDR
jgi:negative regulator of replication initiation